MTLMPTRAVADRLAIPLSTLHKWIAGGRLKPVLKGSGVRGPLFFQREDVERLADELADEAETRAAELRAGVAS